MIAGRKCSDKHSRKNRSIFTFNCLSSNTQPTPLNRASVENSVQTLKSLSSSRLTTPEDSLPHSQQPATGSYPEQNKFSSQPPIVFLEDPF
jgi:hypothetical protein